MGKPGAGKRPTTQRDVFRYGRKMGGEIRSGGRHMKIFNPKTGESVPVPGPGEINRNTLRGIMSRLSLMFAVALVCAIPLCLVACLANGLSSMY